MVASMSATLCVMSSCSEEESDCGFPAVVAAREDFLAAQQAISNASVPGGPGPTPAMCEALNESIADFEASVKNLDENCLRETEKENLVMWILEIATTTPC